MQHSTSGLNAAANREFRLSPQQRRLLRFAAASPAFCARCLVKARGELDKAALRRSFETLIERHEILRTSFRAGDVPLQVVRPSGRLDWQDVDLGSLVPAEQGQRLDAMFREEARRGFDLSDGPAIRVRLVALAQQAHALVVSAPSLWFDHRSLTNLVHELAGAYEAARGGRSNDEPPIQYGDVAEVLTELLEAEPPADASELRGERAAAPAADTGLPFEVVPPGGGREVPRSIERLSLPITGAAARLVASGREEHAGADFFEACWFALLARLTGRRDCVVGTAFDGRTDEALGDAIGLFARYVPLRCEIVLSWPFEKLHEEVRRAAAAARATQDVFAWDQELDYLPVAFEYVGPSPALTAAGVQFDIEKQDACIEPFRVKLSIIHTDKGLAAEYQYDPRLFEALQARRILQRYVRLAAEAAARPEVAVGELPLLDADEAPQLLTFSGAGRRRFKPASVIGAFEDQARRSPVAPAVVAGGQVFSYAELNRRANQLAHYLRRRGVGPDSRVGLYIQRSVDALVAMLGILKAGGAYVPLDPEAGSARLAYQMADIDAPVIVSHRRFGDRLAPPRGGVVDLDVDARDLCAEPDTNPDPVIDPENLVYVIYTSGSSGVPKGVAVTHRSLANYTSFICRKLRLRYCREQMHLAHVSTFFADLGNTVIFPSLVSGGCLDLIPHEVATDPARLISYMKDQRVDVLKIAPSHLSALISAADAADLMPRGHLILGGEKLSLDLWTRLSKAPRTCHIFNHYGPTETTVGSLTLDLDDGPLPSHCASVPIGRPIAHTEIYILDERLQPVPIGTPGELYIGGAGLARGYLDQPEQTAAHFVPHPYSVTGGSRLYRTGDRARYLPDGLVEFLGRADDQVKIRGFRVELNEVSASIRLHPAIAEAVVLAVDDPSGDSRLVAYYTTHPDQSATSANELRAFLADRLPAFMVPAAFVGLATLPLTPNGKIDRRALARTEPATPEAARRFVAARTRGEELLTAIWAEVLRLDRVGIHENFFELGGDSIHGIQIAAKAARAGLRFTPLDLFRCPTVAELGSLIASRVPGAGTPDALAPPREPARRAALDPETLDRIRQMVTPPE